MMADACPVCGSMNARQILRRDHVPVVMHRLYPTQAGARAAPSGTLDFRRCDDCGFGWNGAFDASLVVYDEAYENDQTHSPTFLAHIQERAEDMVAALPADEMIDYLEPGCGQGTFIGQVVQVAGARLLSATGFDPAWRGADTRGPHGSCIHKAYFDEATAGWLQQKPNLVASRHTIEHIADPLSFFRSLRSALGGASEARVFIETPCLDWIIQNGAIQDFFYEHCSLFTAESLRYALEASGFLVRRVSHVFGGQYLWAEAAAATGVIAARPAQALRPDFAGVDRQFTTRWRSAVQAAAAEGPVAIWGAGAKGMMFALLADPENTCLDHAIDINPRKQGLHFAVSGLLVLSPEDSAVRHPRTIFVMNPNYTEEIRDMLSGLHTDADLVPIQ